MKLFFVLLSLSYSLLGAIAQDAAFALDFYEEYTTALAQAKKENKLLMLVIVQDPCPYCDRLVDDTLADPKVTKALEAFVSVIVDKHSQLPSAFTTDIAPYTFFIDPKNEEGIWESIGYVTAEQFLDDMKEAQLIHTGKHK